MAWYKPQQHPPPCVLELGEMISVCVVKHWLCCTNAEGATVCPRDLIAWIQHSESNSDMCWQTANLLWFSAFSMVWSGCSPGTVVFEALLFDNFKGCQLWVLQTWNSHERLFKVPWTILFWTFSSRSLLLGSFCFPSSLLFLSLAMLNFPGFHGKMPDF